jgi:hypothetical protein
VFFSDPAYPCRRLDRLFGCVDEGDAVGDKMRLGNCVSRLWPMVSAVMPVPSET